MTYAKIVNDTVVNLIEIRQVNAHEFPDCVPTNGIPAEIGDTYTDGVFYRNGERVQTAAELAAEAGAAEMMAIITGEVGV